MEDDDKKKKKTEIPVEEIVSSAGYSELATLNVDDLQKLLNEVLEQEDYLKAIAIRDEINRRK